MPRIINAIIWVQLISRQKEEIGKFQRYFWFSPTFHVVEQELD